MKQLTFSKLAFWLGSTFFMLPFFALTIAVTCFMMGISALFFSGIIGILGAGIWVYYGWKQHELDLIKFALIFPILIMIPLWITNYYFDSSYDGQWYHLFGTVKLMDDWNPYKGEIPQNELFNDNQTWVTMNYYPRAFWIIAATIGKLTHSAETGKALHWYFMFGTGFLTYYALNFVPSLRRFFRVCIAIFTAFNPVCVNQWLSFYNDGLVSSLTFSFVALAFAVYHKSKRNEKMELELIVMGVLFVISMNLKITTLFPFSITCAVLGGFLLFQKYYLSLRKIVLILAAFFVFGFTWIGYRPLFYNTITYGHPAYPLNLPNYYQDIVIKSLQPQKHLLNASRPKRLWISLISNCIWNEKDELPPRIPFTMVENEMTFFKHTDPPIAGWGPFFSGILCLGLIMIVGTFAAKRKKEAFIALTFMLITAASALFIENSAWARYIPHIFLMGLIPAVLGGFFRNRFSDIMMTLIVISLCANAGIIAYTSVAQAGNFRQMLATKMQSWAKEGKTIVLHTECREFYTTRERLKKFHLNFKVVKTAAELPCAKDKQDTFSSCNFCVLP